MEETSKYGVLGRHQPCSEERIEILSDTIERNHLSRHAPILLYPESCSDGNWINHVREGKCVTSSPSKDFLETWLDERIGFGSCSTTRRFPTNPIQIMIERGNSLFALKQEHPVHKKSKHVLFVKNLGNMIERWNPAVCLDEYHEQPAVVCSEQTTHPRFSFEGQNLI